MKFLFVIILWLPFFTKAQTLVTGNITHAFNANAASVADAEAKVYLLKYEGEAINLYESIITFLKVKNLRNQNNDVPRLIALYNDSANVIKRQKKYESKYIEFQNTIAKIKADEVERNTTLQSLNAENNEKFNLLDKSTAKELSQAKLKSFENRILADASGNFLIKDKPIGQYVVLIISKNRNGFTTTEASGKVFVKQINIKEGEPMLVNAKFIPD